ncbi:DNA polymerase III subunit gamma/tau [Microbacterium sp. E-13]|uniref:DNA polymerase III subunit gamma/tau n=1 Tax=Microbacterium sp. E-13 TaxID=3404048 RepID=UPI003CF5526D
MTTGRDDDALTWDGDDDPTLDLGASAADDAVPDAGERAGGATAPTDRLPAGFTAVGKGSDALSPAAAQDGASAAAHGSADEGSVTAEREPMGNGTLVALGVLGGVYAIFAIGWLIGGLRLQGRAQYLVLDVMYQGSLWLAVLAPVLWFTTTLLLTRRSRAWLRFTWLAAGVVLLLPWPFVMIGAVGQ